MVVDDTGDMNTTGSPTGHGIPSILASALAELRARRAQREARRQLVRELSTYTTPADRDDLTAILARYDDADVKDIREILARTAAA